MTDQDQYSSPSPRHPAVIAFHQTRIDDAQLRVADSITAFAGSMPFVHIHALAFALWMLLAESSP